jgi:hypothetical protein
MQTGIICLSNVGKTILLSALAGLAISAKNSKDSSSRR